MNKKPKNTNNIINEIEEKAKNINILKEDIKYVIEHNEKTEVTDINKMNKNKDMDKDENKDNDIDKSLDNKNISSVPPSILNTTTDVNKSRINTENKLTKLLDKQYIDTKINKIWKRKKVYNFYKYKIRNLMIIRIIHINLQILIKIIILIVKIIMN